VDVIQIPDGISATVPRLMPPLIAADLTRRTGRLNLAILDRSASRRGLARRSAAGWIADRTGTLLAFLSLAAVGVMATLLLKFVMPETRPKSEAREAAAAA
jgi:hypothetical protein